jgi:hypothetical protein
MASEKKYPVEITRDADGNEQAALNSAVCEAIASEDAFKDKPLSVIAAEYVRRAKAEDPDMDAAFQLDPKQAFSLGASLPRDITGADLQKVVDELKAKGYNAGIRFFEKEEEVEK